MALVVQLPRFTGATTCLGIALLVFEFCVAPLFMLLRHLSVVHRNLFLIGAIASAVGALSGLLGSRRSTPAVMAALIISIAATFSFVLLSGISIISALDVRSAVVTFLNKSLLPISQEYNKELLFNVRLYLYCSSAAFVISALLHLDFARRLFGMVGGHRGCTAYLQSFSLVTFPFALFMMAGGQYIVDSGTVATAPYTGLIVFVCGTIMLSIASLAFLGGSFEYRHLLSACCLLSYITGTCLMALSITYLAMRGQIQANIESHWDHLRVLLPPTYQARYDRNQFIAFIQTNLLTFAYVGLVCGLFLLHEASLCVRLMHHTTLQKRQEALDRQAVKEAAIESGEKDMTISKWIDVKTLQRYQWTRHFDLSKRRQRIAMRIIAIAFMLAVLFIFGVMCADVVFILQCNGIAKALQRANVTLFDATNASQISSVTLRNRFSSGSVTIAAVAKHAASLNLEVFGDADRVESGNAYYSALNRANLNIEVIPARAARFLWVDPSCQRSVLHMDLPSNTSRRVVLHSNVSVEVHGPITMSGLDITTGIANAMCADVTLGTHGLLVSSQAGEVDISNVVVQGNAESTTETRAMVHSELGPVSVENITMRDCDGFFETGAGTLELTNLQSVSTVGMTRLTAKSESGTIYATELRANWIAMQTDSSAIFAAGIHSEGSTAMMGRLEATSVSGDIMMQQIDPSGSVHIETSSGSIRLQLKSLGFVGFYYLRSDRGNVSIRMGSYATDILTPLPDSTDHREKQGGINCNISSRHCLSYGDLHLHSRLGNIEVILGCDNFQCT